MKNIKICSILLILASVAFSCKSNKRDTQGIQGQVFWIEGNQMPQVLEEGEIPDRGHRKGTKRTLRVHELTHINQARLGDALFGEIETPLVVEVETDEEGKFSVELPAGRYSVFTVEEHGYFANIFDLDSYINPFEVQNGKWTQADILINYKATY
jgi:hypothetical protein